MKSNDSQLNIGFGNTNTTIIINIGEHRYETDIFVILNMISSMFAEEDKKINDALPQKVLVNKIDAEETYRTEKIISSLLKLGIPLTATYEIAKSTTDKIWAFIKEPNRNNNDRLSTKDIRRMVSLSIQEMDLSRFSCWDIENWTNKYSRRYGHNNRIVEIYGFDNGDIVNISYDFIRNTLIPDVVSAIAGNREIRHEITGKYEKEIAEEILAFVNQCDLYRINYKILKNMVIEIALQPPHPWFINDSTKKSIIAYDCECLINNINKITCAINNIKTVPQASILEVLHHASAIILESHNYFLGCYDLSCFFLLKNLLEKITTSKHDDVIIDLMKLSSLLADIVFANIDINQLMDVVLRINKFLLKKNVVESNLTEFNMQVLNFGKMAIAIKDLGKKEQVHKFLTSKWNLFNNNEIVENVKLLFYSVYPCKSYNLTATQPYFWLQYSNIISNIFSDKKKVFVVCNTLECDDYSFLHTLKHANVRNLCDRIFVVCEKKEDCFAVQRKVCDFLTENHIDDHYITLWFDKQELLNIFNSENKIEYFDSIIENQTNFDLLS